ncbi:triose-phosphate isomerase [Candidatus Nitrotoga sp. M5]|uniref:triose-phosphate isomerase n=1 Tax=Candidatus Nitrotoga sp. M5 TaxID=2890409 RepID=UPI001EF1847C|nr:triose-phosphate isomerase [Candidatus Nitrotoga sp. M5]CAH1386029.1 Triosephosphate isomerase [Candidatus Nitrotoga sp. M5]
MQRKFIVGNWKMNGALANNETLLKEVANGVAKMPGVDCAVCVPFPYLAQTQSLLHGTSIKLGAQNVHQANKGAYTGEVSVSMLSDFNCDYVIVGHSERRNLFGESSQLVAEKFASVQKAGLLPIICVGETLEQRETGITEAVVTEQLAEVSKLLGEQSFRTSVIAYEPVWAIGTGKTATPEQAQEVHAFIRKNIAGFDEEFGQALCILYGGSVNPTNAAELFSMPDIDGGLIGGASLVAEDFLAICNAGQK